jgi:transitional endoplasmic reticulum ATPase
MVENQKTGIKLVLRVKEAPQADVGQGRARLDTGTRMSLGLDAGDFVEIKGKKITVARVFRTHQQEEEGKSTIKIDSLTRKNAGVSIGDRVEVKKTASVPAERVVLSPIVPGLGKLIYLNGVESFIKKQLMGRPVAKGDTIAVSGLTIGVNTDKSKAHSLFMVAGAVPKGAVHITDKTALTVREETVGQERISATRVAYEDVGGVGEQLERVRELIELPLKHPELFERLGISPPKGVLLYGPPGTGKTLIAKAVANEASANFYSIQGPEIMGKFYGQSEERLREKFEEASKNAPAVLFIDEIDSIAPKRDEVQGEVERRVVAQLLTIMDGLDSRGNLIVIGATNREDALDPALRRPGRFDREIEIGVPSREGRKEILQIHTRGMPIDCPDEERDLLLEGIAAITHGFVGADLAALTRETAMRALRRYLPEIDLDSQIPIEMLNRLKVTRDDFFCALREIEPSSLREVSVDIPKVRWDDIGGLEDIKRRLREAIELPLSSREAFERLGVTPQRGILLYGPPGTGKTMLAQAAATEGFANFVSINGPEVFSKWVGESEKAIRQLFKKAKQAAPSIIFIDELDALAPARNAGYTDSGVTERVVNQLLTSIDGLKHLDDVVIIAATNRPDILDPALLRPGRFDRWVLVPVPDRGARLEILKVHTRRMPLQETNLDEIAKRTDGFVGADIEALCREAGINALRRDIRSGSVTAADFELALKAVHPTVNPEMMANYETFRKELESGISKWKKDDTGNYLR